MPDAALTMKMKPLFRRWAGIIAVLAAASGFGLWMGRVRTAYQGGSPGLVVAASSLDFGQVWEQSDFRWGVAVRNALSEEVRIDRIRTSCGCCSNAEPSSLVLPAGESGRIRLAMDLQSDGARSAGPEVRPVGVELLWSATSKDHLGPREGLWLVHGQVRRGVAGLPKLIDFSTGCVRGSPFPTLAYEVTVRGPFDAFTVECPTSEALIEAEHLAESSDGGSSASIRVTPSSDLPLGRFEFPFYLRAAGSQENRPLALRVEVVGTVVEEIEIAPSTLYLGVIEPGEKVERSVRLRSRTGCAFSVETVDCSDDAIRVETCPESTPEDRRFRVVLSNVSWGNHQERITFWAQGELGARIPLEVPVVYHSFRHQEASATERSEADE